jgi:ABC-type sugar transport system ATPase subunit
MQISPEDPARKLLLQLKGIVKGFAGVQALKGVDFDLGEGEVHALMGENGAGKSTLMKILFGVQPADSGTIEIEGHGEVKIDDPRHALALGIGLVSQEPSLVPQLDVAQNIFLGQTDALSVVKRSEFQAKAREILQPLARGFRLPHAFLLLEWQRCRWWRLRAPWRGAPKSSGLTNRLPASPRPSEMGFSRSFGN